MEALVPRSAGPRGALHDINGPNVALILEIDAFRGAPERAHLVHGRAIVHTRQRDVRPERTTVYLAALRLTGHFDVVMQQLEPRIAVHSHPYDASSAKVRKCAHFTHLQHEGSVAMRHVRERVLERWDHGLVLLAKKLEREMQP